MVLPTITKHQKIVFYLFFTLCLVIQIIPVVRSGLNYSYGIGFWGPNGHDGIWHLSLINHITNPFKINMPIFSGEILRNYHPFFDILIAYASKITTINSSIWLFQIFPLLSSGLFLLFSFKLGHKLTGKFSTGLILMLLNTISNSFGWLVSLFRSGSFGGESLFWAMQSPSNQLNPPFMLSILLLLILIYLLHQQNPSKISIFFTLIFLPIIKVYSALPAFTIFFFYVLKHKKYFTTLILSFTVAVFLFFQYNSASSSLISFQPFWFINSMVESSDRLYLPRLANARYTLESSGKIGPRLIAYYLATISIFYLGNFAWRFLSLFEIKKNKSIFIAAIICSVIPLFFIQKGTSWNTIQFLYYALFLLNIPLSLYLTKHRTLSYIVIFFSLIPLIGSLPGYIGKIPPTAISTEESAALDFLKQQPKGAVLTFPYDPFLKKSLNITPLPIYAYETTSYVAAYSHHITFFEDEMNLENSGYDWQPRRQDSLSFFEQNDVNRDRGFLVNNQIDYIYLPKEYAKNTPEFSDQMYLDQIFENSKVIIYQVKR